MLKSCNLDAEDEKIINELDNLCGVVQNKEVLRDIIIYTKLKQNNQIDFGNYNIIVRNDSSYHLLNDLIKVCAKLLMKYNVILNDKICYLDKLVNGRRDCPFDKIIGVDESIIIINERKLRINFVDELDNLKRVMNQFKDKIFIFEDTDYMEGEIDAELGELATWRMTIQKISLDDKVMYFKNILENNNIKFKRVDIKEFVDVPFWMLKNMTIKLLIECKSKNLNFVDKQMLKKNKQLFSKNNNKRTSKKRTIKTENSKNLQFK